MPEGQAIAVFTLAALALLLTPGPAVLYIIARSVDQGRRAGVASAFGTGLGNLIQVGAAVLGLSTLLLSSALAFSVVKYLGAAYLIYLGLRKLASRPAAGQARTSGGESLGKVFSQGVVVNVFNPKVTLFFFAFLPQFVRPGQGSIAGQILFFGLVFVVMGMCTDSLYALLAGTLSGRLKNSPIYLNLERYFAGGVYLILGVSAALAGPGHA
jgi:threonine/homoserine/homoserine lactone efflux protein